MTNAKDPLDEVITFGKYASATWRQVLNRDPMYCRWVIGIVDWLPEDISDAISEDLNERINDYPRWEDFDD
jgi:hypothetical protein